MPAVHVEPPISADKVIRVARSQKGRRERPPGSNRTKYGKAFGLDGVLWCGIFVWWVFDKCGIDLRDHAFEIVQIAREATGETVRQQAEGLVGRGTVIPPDPNPGRRRPRVRAVAGEPAAARGMPGTTRESCILPRALGNIGLAGQRAWIAQLHRPGGARGLPWRAPSPSPPLDHTGRRGRFLSHARATTPRDAMTRTTLHIRSAAPLPRASRRGHGRCRACGRTERAHKSLGKPHRTRFPTPPTPLTFFG